MTGTTKPHSASPIIETIAGIGVTRVAGPEVPGDGAAGYAPGCICQHLDGGVGSAFYVNEGTVESADFNPHAIASLGDGSPLSFGDSSDVQMLFSTGDASNHAFVLALDDTSQQMHITDKGAKATDWNLSAATHPQLFVHSNTTPATDYVMIGDHDGTEADINVGGGTSLALKLGGTEYASVRVTGLAVGSYVAAATPGTDQLTLKSTGTAPSSTGANVGHLYADYETDDDELFWLSGTVGTATQLTT